MKTGTEGGARMVWVVLIGALGLWSVVLGQGCAATTTTERLGLPPLAVVPEVDLKRYTGRWYEIASFPQSYQEGCTATTATYELRADGEIDVLNQCRKGSINGPENSIHGRARVVQGGEPGKLEVSFLWPFWGAYWIIDLDREYRYAVVGHPSRDSLWILARTPEMEPDMFRAIVTKLNALGYETTRLVSTVQKIDPKARARQSR